VGETISQVLPDAIGVAISPVPIIAVILMLFSARARVNGPAFLRGWWGGLAIVSGVFYVVADQSDVATSSAASDTVSWGYVVGGALLVFGGLRRWARRPAAGVEEPLPKWMQGIDALAPAMALVLGLALSGVNPKNFVLSAAAGSSVAQTGASTADAIVALVVFVVLGSITIWLPVGYALIRKEQARARLDEMKSWLAANNTAVMAVLLLVFGVVLIAKGLAPITS
jgi:threonine/homoserine/homoserine lactone efflux protein